MKQAQREFHAYDASGNYVGIVVATQEQFNGSGYAEGAAPPVSPIDPVLTPRQFEWLLAFTGLGDIWDALEADTKATDRGAYAQLRAERRSAAFHLPETLAIVSKFRPAAAAIYPNADLSDTAIKTAWAQAAQYGQGTNK